MTTISKIVETKKEFGLVLGGGGAKGIWHIGFLRGYYQTYHRNLIKEAAAISATSIGSVIATILFFNDYNLDIDYIPILAEIVPIKNLFYKIYNVIPFIFGFTSGIFDNEKVIYKNLRKYVNSLEKDFTQTQNVYFTATKIKNRTVSVNKVDFKNIDETIHFATASSNLPIIFKPFKIKDTFYFDGGLTENLPVFPLLFSSSLPVHKTIVMNLDIPYIEIKKGLGILDTLLDVVIDTGNQWSSTEENDTSVVVVSPTSNLNTLIDFSEKNLSKIFLDGYISGLESEKLI